MHIWIIDTVIHTHTVDKMWKVSTRESFLTVNFYQFMVLYFMLIINSFMVFIKSCALLPQNFLHIHMVGTYIYI